MSSLLQAGKQVEARSKRFTAICDGKSLRLVIRRRHKHWRLPRSFNHTVSDLLLQSLIVVFYFVCAIKQTTDSVISFQGIMQKNVSVATLQVMTCQFYVERVVSVVGAVLRGAVMSCFWCSEESCCNCWICGHIQQAPDCWCWCCCTLQWSSMKDISVELKYRLSWFTV